MSLRHLARTIKNVSHSTVGRWLSLRKFSLKSNVKRLSGPPHPDRDRQFRLIRREVTRFRNAGLPAISVDAKNAELIGDFANSGRKWESAEHREEVSVHDFPCDAQAKAIPYGVYDVAKNEGHVVVNTSKNTSRLAVDAIRRWWIHRGKILYEGVKRLLILADSGGSNGCRTWLWKKALQEFCNESGLTVTVRHYPRGASKWNPIEHRLFGPITKNWLGHPLRNLQMLLGLIRGTVTQTGLFVTAFLNRRVYRRGEKVSKEEKLKLNLTQHEAIPLWNYTIKPNNKTRK